MLKFHQVTLSCSMDEKRMEGINFSLSPGENVIIPNWLVHAQDCFFMAILGMDGPPLSGQILFNGKALSYTQQEALLKHRRNLGYVHSENGLLKNLSVQENVLLPLQVHGGYSEHQMQERFQELAYFLLEGINCDTLAWSLKKEEEKRVMLARAVAASPDLIMINCPLLGIELGHQDEMRRLIYDTIFCRKVLPKNSSVILSTEYPFWRVQDMKNNFRIFSLSASFQR